MQSVLNMAKENAVKSKIPIPVDPLPPLSEHTLNRNLVKKNEQHPRQPLETLYQEAINSKRATLNSKKVKTVLRRSNSALTKIDTQHVTIRQNNEDLDWSYNVFKDTLNFKTNNKSTVDKRALDTHKSSHVEENRVEESRKVSTPTLKSFLEPSRIRNIKRSLKRPHSRELIGISPAVNDDKRDEEQRRRLVFTDRVDSNSQPNDSWLNSYASRYNQDYGPDLFNYLMMREKPPLVPSITTSRRAVIINWLVKVNGPKGNPAAVQTAAWYFDTLLSVVEVEINKLQVVAAACYWIALKIHGNFGSAKKLVKIGANAYSAKLLKSAEIAVLKELKFPIQPVVAQDFISYFSWECDSSSFVEIEAAATLIYMAGLVVYKTLTLYPSALAAAAIRNTLNLLNKTELLAKLGKNAVYKAASKKEGNFGTICLLQIDALRKMTSPSFEYRALLENVKNHTLAEKILTCVKNKIYKPA
ncbi:uncharacterized protein LOC123876834 [Maniola jurtina]|uniref:uncharacterized protein LOC123876834 n=1 Tax=Maniola jurtina TaxID=191418 RepID=UPI001E6872C0|nr:uncharacterized protein LOC123876834 [Maniola jurtina]